MSWDKRAKDGADTGWGAQRDARRAVEAWNRANGRILRADARQPDRIRVVEYSTFFGSADARPLRKVLDWLGLAWTACSGTCSERRRPEPGSAGWSR